MIIKSFEADAENIEEVIAKIKEIVKENVKQRKNSQPPDKAEEVSYVKRLKMECDELRTNLKLLEKFLEQQINYLDDTEKYLMLEQDKTMVKLLHILSARISHAKIKEESKQ